MAVQSAYNEIKKKIESSQRGQLFFPDDFTAFTSSDAVRSALVRLCRAEVLIRVAQGIYYYPKIDTKWGSGIIPPSIEDIANGIAKRDKVRIAPTGTYVLNLLGLPHRYLPMLYLSQMVPGAGSLSEKAKAFCSSILPKCAPSPIVHT